MGVGKVYLVGAGPGDAGLFTLRGLECLRAAEVVVADHLVSAAVLAFAPLGAEVIVRPSRREGPFGGQEELNQFLVERGRAGKIVVRLKGGDPFVFGRGGEEAEALADAGIPFEVVPGVTAAIAAPAYAGIPVTHRGLSGVVAFATGHEASDKEEAIDWDAVARGAGTLVLYMSVKRLPEVVRRLLAAGRSPDEPAAVVEQGTLPAQRTVTGTLATIVARAEEAAIRPPALTIVGAVVALREKLAWFEQRLAQKRILLVSTKDDGEPGPDGFEVVRVSPFTVIPRFAQVKQALGQLGAFRAVAFASAHAVDAVVGALMAMGLDVRALAGCKLAAVGAATAERLAEMHLRADLTAAGGGATLADEIAAARWEGPILLPRAAGGRDELADGLRAAGYAVEALDAYETVPDGAALSAAIRQHRARPFFAIGFASPRGVEAFLDAAGGARAVISWGVRLGAIGETTRAALAAAGLSVDVVPDRPSLAALLDRLRQIE